MSYPSIYIFMLMCLGIIIQYFFPISIFYWLGLLSFGLITSFIIHKKFYGKLYRYYIFCLGVVFIGIGAILLNLHSNKWEKENLGIPTNEKVWVMGELYKKEKSSEFYNKWWLKVHAFRFENKNQFRKTRVLLRIPVDDKDSIRFNKHYRIWGKFTPVSGQKYPYTFDYSAFMKRRGIYYQFTADSILSADEKKSNNWKQHHLNLLQKIDNSELNSKAKEAIKALTLADRTDMSKDTIQTFSLSGIIHLFAISGLHIGLLFVLIYSLIRPFFSVKNVKYAIVISLFIITLYGAFIQFPVSVTRALIMIWLYSGFKILKRPVLPFHVLALAGIIILLFNPFNCLKWDFS